MLAAAVFAILLALITVLRYMKARKPRFFRRPVVPPPIDHGFVRKKPDWVRIEIIKLKARMPHEGCRTIAHAFNARFQDKRESVGKTYVARVIARNRAAILLERNALKRRPRRQGPRNLTWAMDLTFIGTDPTPVLGILDHGTRALLHLQTLRSRTTISALRVLLDVIEKFGRPRFLRTDNEPLFASRTMKLALAFLGIRHPAHRSFLSVAKRSNRTRLQDAQRTAARLVARCRRAGRATRRPRDSPNLVHHARPHQSLQGLSPAMAWSGVIQSRKPPRFFSVWDGILAGWVPWS